jgi:hypothetical protein
MKKSNTKETEFMPCVSSEIKKGKLTKVDGKWLVSYITEQAGENNWHSCLPIYELENQSEKVADLKLVERYNVPVCKIEGLSIEWRYVITNGVTNFGYEYATLVAELKNIYN